MAGDGPVVPTAGVVTSPFNPRRTHPVTGQVRPHNGTDIGAPTGQPIVSVYAGTVIYAERRGGCGLTVLIDHGESVSTRYCHMSSMSVIAGQQVQAGEQIGAVGSTGLSTGPHLHWEVIVNGAKVNPEVWWQQQTGQPYPLGGGGLGTGDGDGIVAVTDPGSGASATAVSFRFDVRADGLSAASVESFVMETLNDRRGWGQAGFQFTSRPNAPYTIHLVEPADAQALCQPYDVGQRYSCQIGGSVVLNADRWRNATPGWTASIADYRRMLINHEVGHLIGRHHATEGCATPGGRSAVMWQQSRSLDGCTPNAWPLDWEIDCARTDPEPIAPGYEPTATADCGPPQTGSTT